MMVRVAYDGGKPTTTAEPRMQASETYSEDEERKSRTMIKREDVCRKMVPLVTIRCRITLAFSVVQQYPWRQR
jgi:hypothetical protein